MFESVDAVAGEDPAVLARALFELVDADVAALPLAGAEAVALAAQRVISAVAARQTSAVETVARRCDEEAEVARTEAAALGARLPHVGGEQVAASSLAALLRVSPRTMSTRVRHARQVVCLLPQVHEAAWAGDLEPYRVQAVARESDGVPLARIEEFEARLVAKDVTNLPCSALRQWARRCAERCTAAEDAALRARAASRVWIGPGAQPGLSRLTADLPIAQAARLWAAIDALAGEYARARPGQPIGAARADALLDLVEANATITTTLELVAPIDCEAPDAAPGRTDGRSGASMRASVWQDPGGCERPPCDGQVCGWTEDEDGQCLCPCRRDDLPDGQLHSHLERAWFVAGPATVPGVGALLPADVAALMSDPDATLRLARTDRYTGAVRWQDPTAYRPGARVARAVRSRDGTCRFPGCATAARRCQLDHVVAFPRGHTEVANLQALCSTHHGFKHHAGWTVTMTREGICTWTAPDGRTHTTMPLDRHGTAAA